MDVCATKRMTIRFVWIFRSFWCCCCCYYYFIVSKAGIHFHFIHFIWFPLWLLLLLFSTVNRMAIGVCPYLSSSSICRFTNEKVIISQSKINYEHDSYSWTATRLLGHSDVFLLRLYYNDDDDDIDIVVVISFLWIMNNNSSWLI